MTTPRVGLLLAALVVAGLLVWRMTASEQAAEPEAASVADNAMAEPDLEAIRQATLRFSDIEVAKAAGYIPAPGDVCETAPMMGLPAERGAMGVHYFRPDLLGISGPPNPRVDGNGIHTDFLNPGVLLYEPQPDGSMVLVGVENLVFAAAWAAAGNTEPPTFHGVAFDYMIDDPATEIDDAHMFEPHYDRHVWIHRDNPTGVFSQFNPAVSCASAPAGDHQHS